MPFHGKESTVDGTFPAMFVAILNKASPIFFASNTSFSVVRQVKPGWFEPSIFWRVEALGFWRYCTTKSYSLQQKEFEDSTFTAPMSPIEFVDKSRYWLLTVDGSEIRRSPVDIVNNPLFTGFRTYWVVQDFFHQQYHWPCWTRLNILQLYRHVSFCFLPGIGINSISTPMMATYVFFVASTSHEILGTLGSLSNMICLGRLRV